MIDVAQVRVTFNEDIFLDAAANQRNLQWQLQTALSGYQWMLPQLRSHFEANNHIHHWSSNVVSRLFYSPSIIKSGTFLTVTIENIGKRNSPFFHHFQQFNT